MCVHVYTSKCTSDVICKCIINIYTYDTDIEICVIMRTCRKQVFIYIHIRAHRGNILSILIAYMHIQRHTGSSELVRQWVGVGGDNE